MKTRHVRLLIRLLLSMSQCIAIIDYQESVDNYLFSINYHYPQRFLQRIVCLGKEIYQDVEELSKIGYLDPLVCEVCRHIYSLKKAVVDLLDHEEEAAMYLHEDIQFIIDFVCDIDRILLVSAQMFDRYYDDNLLMSAHNEMHEIYRLLLELRTKNREVLELEAPIDIDTNITEYHICQENTFTCQNMIIAES